MNKFEIRYMPVSSARNLRVWLVHAARMSTPAAGPLFFARLFGWSVGFYPSLPGSMRCHLFVR